MKKIILTLVCLLGMSMAANAAFKSDIVLQHGSNITVYNAEDFAAAMEAAVDGDVIFLGEGKYPGFGINKKITVQGVGEGTIIEGDITIDIPNEPVLTAPILQYMVIRGGVSVMSVTRGLGFKQCQIGAYLKNLYFDTTTYDAYIDRCVIADGGKISIARTYTETITINGKESTFTYPYVKGLTVTNSIVEGVYGSPYSTNVTFVNCDIAWLLGTGSLGTVINSMIHRIQEVISTTKFVNTYIPNDENNQYNCTTKDCYFAPGTSFSYDSEELITNGYLGNDGTVVGPLGGTTPFTFVPDVPKVTLSNFKVDHQKEELNVTLTATPE